MKPNSLALEFIDKQLQNIDDVIVEALEQIGEQFVTDARDMGNYMNRTGNLRSSIGYIVCFDGKPVHENFETFEDGKVGTDTAKKMAEEITADLSVKGYSLVVVAGMNYAAAVEAKSFDVLTGASLIAAKDLQERIKLIKKLIGQ